MNCERCEDLEQRCPQHNALNAKDAAAAAGVALSTFYSWQLDPIARDGRTAYWLEADVLAAERTHRRNDPSKKRQKVQ